MPSPVISKKDQETLLKCAREVLEKALKDSEGLNQTHLIKSLVSFYSMENNSPAGVFITLKKSGSLRGCIGTIFGEKPLLESVTKMTLQSAFCDPRFPPLAVQELEKTKIEISVLSPMKKIKSLDEIIPFQHGVYVKSGFHSGVFLPQVWEQLPDKKMFLKELCFSKAGLSPDAYQDPKTEIFIYTVDHFEEKD